jgi:predicted MFS family arabinose efflux permease
MLGCKALSARESGEISENKLLTVLALVQFVNVLEFMIVMPLGPDFATALDIPVSHLGWIGGAYTLSAAVAGIAGSSLLDRFGRRAALCASLFGLALATVAAAASTGLVSLIAARLVAGAFGGPATALGYAIIADVVPPRRRGRAMGIVLGSFSVASVLGVPLGLELARLAGWRAPFFVIAALTLAALLLARVLLPPLRGHLTEQHTGLLRGLQRFIGQRAVILSLLATTLMMMGIFAMVPHLSAFFQYNMGYPRDRLGILYMVGGAASFVAMQIGGRLVDRFGPFGVATAGTALLAADLGFGFIERPVWMPALAVFVAMMLGNSIRAVAVSSLSTRVPNAGDRARFLSLQSSVQHGASALGALVSTSFLRETPNHELIGIPGVATFALVMVLAVPPLVVAIEGDVRKREELAQ